MAISRTAQYVALYRALESCEPRRAPLFRDPFAPGFLSPQLAWVVRLARRASLRRVLEGYADFRAPGARSSAIARTRFIDDVVRREIAAGSRQLVIFGAGFDCRAHRLPELRGVRVFEVDRPDTQRQKREILEQTADAQRSPDVTYVPLDLLREDIASALGRAGWAPAARCTFLCEGLSNYLSEASVKKLLRCVGSSAPESVLAFSYVHSGVLDGSTRFAGDDTVLRNVRRLGEPWSFGLDPRELEPYFADFGLNVEEDVGADEYRRRYLDQKRTHWGGYTFYRLVIARVRGST
ncbi:MAG TPA: SAM-dependent methyltransferase [Polyangiaceae bacterium]|nr:SAM-dependent methyltransferase [Polyangiaceae bacterium]